MVVREEEMLQIRINPQEPMPGVVTSSWVSWDNPNIRKAINKLFQCGGREVIIALDITDDGMKATFVSNPERKPDKL